MGRHRYYHRDDRETSLYIKAKIPYIMLSKVFETVLSNTLFVPSECSTDDGFCELQVEFFVGYPAVNLRQQGDTVGALKRKVDRLLGVSETGPPNPPWVTCCLMSYYLDKQHPQESRRYRIFGTRFPG